MSSRVSLAKQLAVDNIEIKRQHREKEREKACDRVVVTHNQMVLTCRRWQSDGPHHLCSVSVHLEKGGRHTAM